MNGMLRRMMVGGLMAVFMTACDNLSEQSGSLEGKETTSFLIHLESDLPGKKFENQEQRTALDILVRRLKDMDVRDFKLELHDEASLRLDLPKVDENWMPKLVDKLEKTTEMHIHQVSERSDEIGPDGRTLAERVLAGEELVPGQRAYIYQFEDWEGNAQERAVLLYRRAALDGSDVADAFPSPQQEDAIGLTLTADGAKKMRNLTSGMRLGMDRLAVLIDEEPVNVATVQAVLSKNIVISGLEGGEEAQELADQLRFAADKTLRVEQIK